MANTKKWLPEGYEDWVDVFLGMVKAAGWLTVHQRYVARQELLSYRRAVKFTHKTRLALQASYPVRAKRYGRRRSDGTVRKRLTPREELE